MHGFRTALLATALVTAGLMGAANAATIQGSSSGTFSSLSSCDNSGTNQDCRIVNSNTQVQWGSTSSSTNFVNPSTLTAAPVTIGPVNTNANDVVIARLDWFNSPTLGNETPDNFNVNWNLTITFTQPVGSSDPNASETFNLSITNPTNPPGDYITGFTLAALNGLELNLNGVERLQVQRARWLRVGYHIPPVDHRRLQVEERREQQRLVVHHGRLHRQHARA
jgi:hypothetical protein